MNMLPETSERMALDFPWFPTRWQAVLWRNWGKVPVERLQRLLCATEDQLRAGAEELGLDPALNADPIWLTRGYLTIIRENWHLCSFEQIQILLDIDADRLAFLLKEDDFLWHKMGSIKPSVPDNRYAPLTVRQQEQTDKIRTQIQAVPANLRRENAFGFVRRFSQSPLPSAPVEPSDQLSTIYSYFALYGDPLLEAELDPFPDSLLAEYARMGVRGVWLQGILYQLVECPFAPDLCEGREIRLNTLNSLIERAGKYGIGVYLYLNEPRALDLYRFEKFPHLQGEREDHFAALCTSQDEVKRYLEEGVRELFTRAPGLAGFFTITMSENLTNCWSRCAGTPHCPRCAERKPWEVVAEVNNLMARGAHAANPKARAIAWSWAWKNEWAAKVPPLLTEGQIVQCVSEEALPTHVGGVEGMVRDYSISQVGPSDIARGIWKSARESGLEASAKVQINNTWEMSAVPYLPVFDKVAEHMTRLREAGVRHLQMSWTLGGYPSPMLKMAQQVLAGKTDVRSFLKDWLGEELGEVAHRAQAEMSRAFGEFPFNIGVLYRAPQNYGPMAPLYARKTGWKACMIGFPYDDLQGWRAIYDEDTFENQFALLVDGWKKGVDLLAPHREKSADLNGMYRMAAAALCHFESTLHQIRFVRLRDRWTDKGEESDRLSLLDLIEAERRVTLRLLELRQEDDCIGYEASNHYYYTVNDLLEKLLNLTQCAQQFVR